MPKILKPLNYKDFIKISKIGHQLLDLHINYDKQPMYKYIKFAKGNLNLTCEKYYLKKMKFGKYNGQKGEDKTTIFFNENVVIQDIPIKAYDWVLKDRSAIEHVMLGYRIEKTKDQNPNDLCREMKNSKYILELLLKVIYISLKTLKLVDQLPNYNKVIWDDYIKSIPIFKSSEE